MASKIGTFELEKGRTFIAGLFWQPLVPTSIKEARAEAADIADQMSFDMGVFRKSETIQVGLCAKEDGANEGEMSIAAVISKTLEVDALAKDAIIALPVGNGDSRWIYFAQKDGVILSDGDLIGTEDEVRATMHTHYTMANWSYVVCPAYWGFRGAIEKSLEEFLPKTKKGGIRYHKWWGVTNIKVSTIDIARKALPVLMVSGVCAILAAYGWNAYSSWQQQKEMERQAAAAAEAARQEAIMAMPPWHMESNPVLLAKNCVETIDSQAALAPGGWVLNAATCDVHGQMQVSWNRPDYSTISLLRAVVKDAQISESGNSALITRNFVPGAASTEEVLSMRDMVAEIHDRAQRLGIPITFAEIPVPPPQEGLPPQSWRSSKWELLSSISPDELMKWFAMPGLRLTGISLQFVDGISTWKMEGIIYAKNE